MLRAPPFPIVGLVGEYTINGANTVATTGTTNLQFITGANFVETTPADGLVFSASQCKLTAASAGRYLVRLFYSGGPAGIFPFGFLAGAIDLNNDRQGLDVASVQGKFMACPLVTNTINFVYCYLCDERVVSVVAADALRPVLGAVDTGGAAFGADLVVDQFLLTATPIPSS